VRLRLAENNAYQELHEEEKALRHEHEDLILEFNRLSRRKELLTADRDRGLLSLLLGLGKR
jgi:hypothetical protein